MGDDPQEMFRFLPWPFADGRFPPQLGAVVQRAVLSGEAPARLVQHGHDGDWAVADGITDPNAPDAAVATHLAHVIERNSSVAELADLPPGWLAIRENPGEPWKREPFKDDEGEHMAAEDR